MLILKNKVSKYENELYKPLFIYKKINCKDKEIITKEYIKLIFRMKKKDFIYTLIPVCFFFKSFFFNNYFSYHVSYNNLNFIIKIKNTSNIFYYIEMLLEFFNLCEDEDIVVKKYKGKVSKFNTLTYNKFFKDIFLFLFEFVRLRFYFFNEKSLLIFMYVFLKSVYYTKKKVELSFKYEKKYLNVFNFNNLKDF